MLGGLADGSVQAQFGWDDSSGGFDWFTYDGSYHGFSDKNLGLSSNKWYHVVASFDGSYYRIYIDGIMKASVQDSTWAFPTSGSWFIGARNDSGADLQHNGKIDDYRIYEKALTPLQIEKLYHKGAYRISRESTLQ